jgi:hypothetical protein
MRAPSRSDREKHQGRLGNGIQPTQQQNALICISRDMHMAAHRAAQIGGSARGYQDLLAP